MYYHRSIIARYVRQQSKQFTYLLVGLLLIATMSGLLFNQHRVAAAESNTYPWDDAVDVYPADYDWGYATCPTSDTNCKALTMVKNGVTYGVYDPWNYYLRNCTSYVAYRINKEFNGRSIAGWGNGIDFDEKATAAGYSINGNPQVGDIAQWNTGLYGHVAYVYAVNNGVASIAEYNQQTTGRYRNDRTIATGGANFIHMGTPSGGTTPPSTPSGRLTFINNNNAPSAKDEITPGGWHPLLGAGGTATDISASKTHLTMITGGSAYAADPTPANLSANNPGFVPLNVPTTAGYPAGVKKVVTDKDGNMIAINNCNAAYGWRNIPGAGNQQWVSMSNCNDAVDVDVGSGRFGFKNACGGGYISDTGYAWTQARPCNDVKALAIGESGRIMIINSGNTAYLYNPGTNSWIAKGAAGDAQKIAVGLDRVMVIVNSGAAWASDVKTNVSAPMVQVSNVGDALTVSVGANDRMAFISGSGAGWASDVIVQGGSWTSESGAGDTKMLVSG